MTPRVFLGGGELLADAPEEEELFAPKLKGEDGLEEETGVDLTAVVVFGAAGAAGEDFLPPNPGNWKGGIAIKEVYKQ